MEPTPTPHNPGKDRAEFASQKVVTVLGAPTEGADTLGAWIEAYLSAAVTGVRSAEVTTTIARHLARFRTWMLEGFGHDRLAAVTAREVAAWRDHLADAGIVRPGQVPRPMAPATVNNHLAHLAAFFTWTRAHAPAGLLLSGNPTTDVPALPLPAPEARALTDGQVRTVKNVLDRLEHFHRLKGRRHQHRSAVAARHGHARPLRDRALVHVLFGAGLRRAELVALDLAQLVPADPDELRRVKKARLVKVRGKGRTQRSVFLGRDARAALADYLEHERPGDAEADSAALFLAAASIASRRPGGRLSPRTVNTVLGEVGRIHDAEVDGERRLGVLRPHDARHTFAYRLSAASGHNRPELERRLGHANDRYLRLYTNPPEDVAAGWAEEL